MTSTSVRGGRRTVDLRERPAEDRTGRATGRARWPAAALPILLGLAALACLVPAVRDTRLDLIGGLGLAGVLSPWAWVALTCAVLGAVTEFGRARPRSVVLVALTGVVILCSTGLPSLVESAARIPAAWTHLGFVEAIATTGRLPVGVDSRFAWPAFFAQWAWISDAAGGLTLDGVLRWTPPVVVAVWALSVHAIARPLLGGTRAPWVAVWLFLGTNWIEQDYFSPQATAMVLGLAALACVLGPLATGRGDPAGGRWPLPAPGSPPLPVSRRIVAAALMPVRRPEGAAAQFLLLWLVVALCLAGVVLSHPLTPFALGAQLLLLALAGRFWGRWLVLVLVVVELTWFVLGAQEFWQARLYLVTGDVGDVGGSLMSALVDRLVGDPGQLAAKVGRVLLAAATWGLALVGAWVRWRRTGTWLVAALAAAPLGLVLVQSYGGEVLLRVQLYALPFLAVLGAEAVRAAGRRWRGTPPGRVVEVGLVLGMLLLFGLLVVLRGGNDAYVGVQARDVAFSRSVLAGVPPGSKVLRLTNEGPIRVTRAGDVVQATSTPGCSRIADDPLGCLAKERPDLVLVQPAMEAEGRFLDGFAPGWSRAMVERIVAGGTYRVVRDEGTSLVLARVERR
ncbi:hypothetical protein [Actinomycetospora termitidis]|uniref:Glycosyltransferase RgtA/B/C/D-like domain-containing protein n=1 Tax=Actinomycetospora termitidis TaxID=3053470 RepID=A0ABT7MHH6_9PSEU|nr:hypothetical protein [Actinomycetospora sp. Odt1-22]MDL5160135.1 hypothetical protein [Actinomycetospora sp. Odt1-22]